MQQRPTVLILGANGRFGRAAVDAFAAAGWRVLAQVRRAPPAPLPAGAEEVRIALAGGAALAARAAGASVVVHAANPAYTRWDDELMPLLRQGVEVAQRLGARFMLPGNVYNYGASMPALLDEDAPMRPSTTKGAQRVALEAELARVGGQGLASVVIRAGDFYGGGSGSWLDAAVVKGLARGRLVYPGPLDVPHAWAYLPDLARAFVAVAALPSRPGLQTLHFAGHTLTGAEFLDAVDAASTQLGLRPAAGFEVGTMPWRLIRAVGLVVPLWREIARMRYLFDVPHALDGRRLAAVAGPLPPTPVVAALRQSLLDLGFAPPRAAPQTALSSAA